MTRGSANFEHTISLADLPNLNPHDWILLHNILLINSKEYEPIIDHLKRMLVCNILEVAKMDQEVASVLRKKLTILPIGFASDINKMKMGKIDPKLNSVMFTGGERKKCLFALINKHLSLTSYLEHIIDIINHCKKNSEGDKKYFLDMLRWYIDFRQVLLALIPLLFKVVNRTPQPPPM